jgi:SAM-dependent MidA family methyltransferase
MNILRQKIISKIQSEGPISFETFMDMALYEPSLGYYRRDSATIGRAGDFYTSPHLHPIFGAMLGRQMEEMWEWMDRPEVFCVVEMGAGMGYLAKDLMGGLTGREILPHLEYLIIEQNPSIRREQERLLGDFRHKVKWASDLKEIETFSGCFLSNELLDAFPVRLVEMDREWMEIYVALSSRDLVAKDSEEGVSEATAFAEVKRPCGADIRDYFRGVSLELPKGYRTEVNLKLKEWLLNVNEKLSEGFVLTIDYGYTAMDYYSEDRNRGTLLCYHRHQVNEDPYRNIGQQDITAHVNFSSLKKWGDEAGLRTVGFTHQGAYLVSLGIGEVMHELYGGCPDVFDVAKIKGLILPHGMGDSHKVMIQYKGKGVPELRGFSLRNQREKL